MVVVFEGFRLVSALLPVGLLRLLLGVVCGFCSVLAYMRTRRNGLRMWYAASTAAGVFLVLSFLY